MKSKSVKFFIVTFILITTLLICFQFFSQRYDSGINLNTINSKNNDLDEITDEEIIDFELKTAVKEDWHRYWMLTYYNIEPKKILVDALDNIYFIGNAQDKTGKDIIVILKYNSQGEYQWNKTWGDDKNYCNDFAFDLSENIFVTGYISEGSSGYDDIFLAKFDHNGNYQWNRTWGTQYYDNGNGIALDTEENIYIVGESIDYINPGNITIVKFDQNGNYVWNRTLGTKIKDDKAYAITIDEQNNLYIAGHTGSYATYGILDVFVLKYNSSGNQIWNSTWGDYQAESRGIDIDSEHNVYITGFTKNTLNVPQPFVLKLNETGNYKWNYTITAEYNTDGGEGNGISIDPENNVYFSGYFDISIPPAGRDYDILLTKLNSSGIMIWNYTWDGNSDRDMGKDIALDSNENIYIGAYSYTTSPYRNWYLLIKILQTPGDFELSHNAGSPDLDGSYDLFWTKSDSAENYSIYEDDSYINQINELTPIAEGVKALSYQLTNKENGTYYYKVLAFNKYGNTSSECISIVVNRKPPGGFSLSTNAGSLNINGSFYLNWTVSAYATNYSLYKHDSYIYNVNEAILIDEGLTNLSYIFNNYANGTYYFKLVSFNINGNTSSNCIQIDVKRYKPSEFFLDSDASAPDKDGCFNLNWTNSQYAESYTIYRDTKYIKEINGTQTTLVENYKSLIYYVSNLPNGTYYFLVSAININGNCSSNCIQVNVINAPPGPFDLFSNATNPEISGFVTINWNQSLDATNYTMYIDTVPISNFHKNMFNISGITTLFLKLTFPKNGDYYIAVVAFNRNGNYTYPINIVVYVRLAPKPLTLISNAEKPSDSDGCFKLNWSVAYEFSYFKVDITNFSIYYSTQSFSLNNIGKIAGILCLMSNISATNFNTTKYATFNCSNFGDGIWYFMVIAYNSYGNSSSNCLEITISLPIILFPSDDDDDGSGGNDGSDNNIILIVIAGSTISGAVGVSSIAIIIHKKKMNHLKKLKLNKIVQSVQQTKEGQNRPKDGENN